MDHTKNHDNNVLEQQRLEGQHEVMIYTMGKPVYTPIDFSEPGLRILDSGCANGMPWYIPIFAGGDNES